MKLALPDTTNAGMAASTSGNGKRALTAALGLSPRARDVVELAANGFPAPTIAYELGRSVHEVNNEIRVAKAKLGAASLPHLVAMCVQVGVVKLAPDKLPTPLIREMMRENSLSQNGSWSPKPLHRGRFRS